MARQKQLVRAYLNLITPADIRCFLLFFTGYLLSVWCNDRFYASLAVPSPFWFPDSVLLCALLLSQRRYWWIILLAVWPIRLVAGSVPGTPSWFVLLTIAIDSCKAFLAASLLRKFWPGPGRLATLREFMIFLGIAAGVVPFISALAAAPARHALGDPLWSAGYRWFLGDALAQVIVTPMLLYWFTRSHRRITHRWKESAILFMGLTVSLYYGFVIPHSSNNPIFLFAPVLPFLVWAALRLRPFGTANCISLMAAVSLLSAFKGTGVFAGYASNQDVLSIQLFLLVVAIPTLSLAILTTERESKMQELQALLDAASITILTATDAECKNIVANRGAYQMYRLPIGSNLSMGAGAQPFRIKSGGVDVSPQELPLQRAVATGKPVIDYDSTLVLDDGTERYLTGNATPLLDEDGKPRGAIGVFIDVTERKLAELALSESEERFRLVANTAPVLIWMADANGICTFFNRGWLDFTGRSLEQELRNGWSKWVHPDDAATCQQQYLRALEAQEDFKMEYRLLRADGEYRWVVDHGVCRLDSNGTFCGHIGSCIDITERKLAEERLHELSGRLIQAQEDERTRIARELHDDFSQRLAALQISIARVRQSAAGFSPNARQELRNIAETTAQISDELADFARQLHPSVLELSGLVPALRSFCAEFSKQHSINLLFVHNDMPQRLPRDLSLCLFRIVQEGLRNIVKHSEASEARVELSGNAEHIHLCIKDSGIGFDPQSPKLKKGLGLVSMRERLRLIGGELSIFSKPSLGTEIMVSVPAKKSEPEAADAGRAKAAAMSAAALGTSAHPKEPNRYNFEPRAMDPPPGHGSKFL